MGKPVDHPVLTEVRCVVCGDCHAAFFPDGVEDDEAPTECRRGCGKTAVFVELEEPPEGAAG